ncbi:MAG TPA: hypothetical protein VGZ48_00385 [Candidatus Acidoferrales bacterium]|nr:hypothetical protein [Candidatus Acidoferrales bacterium]
MRRLIFVSMLLAAAGAALSAQKPADESARAGQEDDVREAVFRYQFKNTGLPAAYHFIAFDEKNPPDAFLKRFRDDDPPVRPISESHIEKKPIRTVVSKKDGQGGIIFNLGHVKWISDVKAEVEGSYDCGDNCEGVSGTYHAVKQDGRWSVESFDTPKKSSL